MTAGTLATVAVLVGCTSTDAEPLSSGDAGQLALYQRSDEPGGDAAALEGVISLDGGCTYLTADDGQRWLPVFPEGAFWKGETLTSDKSTFQSGERVGLAGGETSLREGDTVPPDCDPDAPLWRVTQE